MQSERVHPLLCPARNPASVPLLAFARQAGWIAVHALAQCTSRLLLAAQADDGSLEADQQVLQSLAVLGMEERFRALRWVHTAGPFGGDNSYCGSDQGVEPDRETWHRAFELYIQAFNAPESAGEQKKLAKILRRPIPETLHREFFKYDAFLRGLGRMSLSAFERVTAWSVLTELYSRHRGTRWTVQAAFPPQPRVFSERVRAPSRSATCAGPDHGRCQTGHRRRRGAAHHLHGSKLRFPGPAQEARRVGVRTVPVCTLCGGRGVWCG